MSRLCAALRLIRRFVRRYGLVSFLAGPNRRGPAASGTVAGLLLALLFLGRPVAAWAPPGGASPAASSWVGACDGSAYQSFAVGTAGEVWMEPVSGAWQSAVAGGGSIDMRVESAGGSGVVVPGAGYLVSEFTTPEPGWVDSGIAAGSGDYVDVKCDGFGLEPGSVAVGLGPFPGAPLATVYVYSGTFPVGVGDAAACTRAPDTTASPVPSASIPGCAGVVVDYGVVNADGDLQVTMVLGFSLLLAVGAAGAVLAVRR